MSFWFRAFGRNGAKAKRNRSESRAANAFPFVCRGEYRPIGETAIAATAAFPSAETPRELRARVYESVPSEHRARIWRYLFGYVPLNAANERESLERARAEYRGLAAHYTESRLARDGDAALVEVVKLIRKDVQRTLPDSRLFRESAVQEALVRILTVFAVRHPSNAYSQGMNDVLAPLLLVFAAESVAAPPAALNTNPSLLERLPIAAEADAYHCFALLISAVKANYVRRFDGVRTAVAELERLVALCDAELATHFRRNEIEMLQFAFRWIFCLLLREVPSELSVRLVDRYLVEEAPIGEQCLYFALALLLRFSWKLKAMQREQLIVYLQNLPTADWGEGDVRLLSAEAFLLRNEFKNKEN